MGKHPELMIIAGEVSGDMHAAALVHALRKRQPNLTAFGIGGPEMRAAGVETHYDVRDMTLVGFSELIRRFGFYRRVFLEMLDLARTRKPDAVVLVDFPGFNLRFAARAHALGLRTIYYICPQVWAWNRGRIPRMAAIIDRLITIFPFEAEHFQGTGLEVSFAGHPLVDEAMAARAEPSPDLPWNGAPRVAILPGSRAAEIERMFPVMWQAAGLVQKQFPEAGFVVACPGEEQVELVEKLRDSIDGPSRGSIVVGKTRHVLLQAHATLVASGTATIEAALMKCPMVIAYRMTGFTYMIGRMLVKLSDIGMVNIVAGRRICPELIQGEATAPALADAIAPLLHDTPERKTMVADLEEVCSVLGEGNAADRAAEQVLDALELKPES
jgi:lipid-A-disaccharide synthase